MGSMYSTPAMSKYAAANVIKRSMKLNRARIQYLMKDPDAVSLDVYRAFLIAYEYDCDYAAHVGPSLQLESMAFDYPVAIEISPEFLTKINALIATIKDGPDRKVLRAIYNGLTLDEIKIVKGPKRQRPNTL